MPNPLPPPQTESFRFSRIPVQYRFSNPQPHPAVLPHLQRFEMSDIAQSGGWPQEILGTNRDTSADCGLCLLYSPDWESSMARSTEEEEEIPQCLVCQQACCRVLSECFLIWLECDWFVWNIPPSMCQTTDGCVSSGELESQGIWCFFCCCCCFFLLNVFQLHTSSMQIKKKTEKIL